jgi:hypothetical protein
MKRRKGGEKNFLLVSHSKKEKKRRNFSLNYPRHWQEGKERRKQKKLVGNLLKCRKESETVNRNKRMN